MTKDTRLIMCFILFFHALNVLKYYSYPIRLPKIVIYTKYVNLSLPIRLHESGHMTTLAGQFLNLCESSHMTKAT